MTGDVIAFEIQEAVRERCPEEFRRMRFDVRWARGFAAVTMHWTFRKATAAAQKLPEDWEEQLAVFIKRVTAIFLAEVKNAAFVVNSDHTGCRMCPAGDYTYDRCGVKHVRVIGLDDKRQVTVVVGSALDGTMLPWQVNSLSVPKHCAALVLCCPSPVLPFSCVALALC